MCNSESQLLVAEGASGSVQVRWDTVSGNHLVGVSGIHQVNEDLVLAMCGEGSTQESWSPPASYVTGKFNT